MATITVTKMATKTIGASASPSSTLRVAPQSGILGGGNPSHYDPANPIILFIIQVSVRRLSSVNLELMTCYAGFDYSHLLSNPPFPFVQASPASRHSRGHCWYPPRTICHG